ncbi:hypothetical protein KHA93_18460 [Bacillus sp. FJAT-49732]|uniref:Uncharacterized protein n=1 Tax=Lederbergia citrisecunda TaxID=2833583 RepID=A0A942TTR5_9BACI|nr:hypothetical protein [Lederbergia citrisecunda]MBS4201599.1 hypothetical protein [Lederbergia citrisecunda]
MQTFLPQNIALVGPQDAGQEGVQQDVVLFHPLFVRWRFFKKRQKMTTLIYYESENERMVNKPKLCFEMFMMD